MEKDRTTPDEATDREERIEADRTHGSDRQPTLEEELAADRFRRENADEEAEVARHHKEMDEIGADAKGEGRIE